MVSFQIINGLIFGGKLVGFIAEVDVAHFTNLIISGSAVTGMSLTNSVGSFSVPALCPWWLNIRCYSESTKARNLDT